ncbi:hypothetical protein V2W30_03035 [Streptomyces sp. Q6]|uniref:Uncharacterized protein n=1 Tax=Streptomyces citrinus TaxID=3118173 RepID=A0ACD5A5H6_9ACTN
MRRTASLPTAALAAALLGVGVPLSAPAWAEGDDTEWDSSVVDSAVPGTLELVPASARPGTTVTANTTGCEGDTEATGDASGLGAGDFPLRTGTHQGDLVGQFQVPSGARPGTYPISVSCENGTVVRQTLKVTGEGRTELRGTHAGDGGSLGRIGTGQLVLGSLLVAGAVGAAGYYARRRAQEL